MSNLRSAVLRFADARARIPGPGGERIATVVKRGTLDICLSVPVPPNRQTPHMQDELYVVVHGAGVLVHGDQRERFTAGDILFVAAGEEHHYEDFTADLALWRIFYGEPGGEIPP
jgi:mannose-6-phosphate isomerase-like protein (cupin superfamily)